MAKFPPIIVRIPKNAFSSYFIVKTYVEYYNHEPYGFKAKGCSGYRKLKWNWP